MVFLWGRGGINVVAGSFSRVDRRGHSFLVLGLWESYRIDAFKSGRTSGGFPPHCCPLLLGSRHCTRDIFDDQPNAKAYSKMSAINCSPHDTFQGSTLVPGDKWVPPLYAEAHLGPWPWQWRHEMRDLVSTSPSSIRISIKALMDDIEKVGTFKGTRASLTLPLLTRIV